MLLMTVLWNVLEDVKSVLQSKDITFNVNNFLFT